MWHKLEPKDFERLLRSSGAYQAVAAQGAIEIINSLFTKELHLNAQDAQAVQVIQKVAIIETDAAVASAEIRLQETFLLDELRKKGIELTGFRFRTRREKGTR